MGGTIIFYTDLTEQREVHITIHFSYCCLSKLKLVLCILALFAILLLFTTDVLHLVPPLMQVNDMVAVYICIQILVGQQFARTRLILLI